MLKNKYIQTVLAILAVVLLNYVSTQFYTRWDMTKDARYTLSEASINTVKNVDSPIYVDVYLEGNLPAEFRRLQLETKQLLEGFIAENSNVLVTYINAKTINENVDAIAAEMQKFGMPPARVDIVENGKTSQQLVFPWAVINHNKKVAKVALLKNNIGSTTGERINNSIQHLEYAFASAFKNVTTTKIKNIAHIIGNDELKSIHAFDFYQTLEKEYPYKITPFALDSANTKSVVTLQNLEKFDLAIIAKPTKRFTDKEKYVLDQYTMNGGKTLWLIDAVHAEMDSIKPPNFQMMTIARDLNLTDLFFSYGFRVNPVLVKDMYAADIVLADVNGQFNKYPWFYNPLVIPTVKNEIVNNINAVKFEFANSIDLLKQGVNLKKTPLLQSSPLTATIGVPALVSFKAIARKEKPDIKSYHKKHLNLAALLEGNFTSNYKNRVKPFKYKDAKDEGKDAKIIIVADGDIIKNQVEKGKPLALGFDKFTGRTYGNKEFLLNAVNYLLDDTGLLKVRNKEVKISLLDIARIAKEKQKWQFINIGIPLLLLVLFGFGYTFYRKKKYS